MVDSVSPVSTPAIAPIEAAAAERRTDLRQDAKDPVPQSRVVEAVEKSLREMEPPILSRNERLSILRDETTGQFIYQSIDRETGKVVRQWPAESMLQFKAYLQKAEGVLVDRQV
jgi:flagellar protein FlaG